MRNKLSKIIGSGATFLALSSPIFAQTCKDSDPFCWFTSGLTGLTNTTVQTLIMNVINFIIGAAALVSVVMIVWSGYQYMTAGGDEGKVSKATKSLTNAIIGLVIAIVAKVLVEFVKKLIAPAA